jgi:hypothetical protein
VEVSIMKFVAIPDMTTFAFSLLIVIALMTPYLLVRYVMRHHH